MTTTVQALFIFTVFLLVAFLGKSISLAASLENHGELETVPVEEEDIRGEEDEPDRVKRTLIDILKTSEHPRYRRHKTNGYYKDKKFQEESQESNSWGFDSEEEQSPWDKYLAKKQHLYPSLGGHITSSVRNSFDQQVHASQEQTLSTSFLYPDGKDPWKIRGDGSGQRVGGDGSDEETELELCYKKIKQLEIRITKLKKEYEKWVIEYNGLQDNHKNHQKIKQCQKEIDLATNLLLQQKEIFRSLTLQIEERKEEIDKIRVPPPKNRSPCRKACGQK